MTEAAERRISVGFTGTRDGMTVVQHGLITSQMRGYVKGYDRVMARHGDCLGADKEFHGICRAAKVAYLVGHPGHDPRTGKSPTRAYCEFDLVHESDPYLVRDWAIVVASDVLLATPKGEEQPRGSGTWATIRYARRAKILIMIVMPNGQIRWENVDSIQ